MNFANVKGITIPQGDVKSLAINGTTVWKKSRLPSGYQEVEWIGSDGNPYINAQFGIDESKLSEGIRIVLDVKFANTSASQAMLKNNSPYFFMGVNSSRKFYAGLGRIFSTSSVTNDEARHTLELNSTTKKFYIDGNEALSFSTDYPTGGGLTFLFRIWGGSYPCNAELYGCQIYYNGDKVRDFVPCYHISDTVIGLYDLVGKTLFTNVGSGTFTKGADVN